MSPPKVSGRAQERVRKRVANACYRCRKQKIRCSGREPCEQCSKRGLHCVFDAKKDTVVVSREYIANLERQAGQNRRSVADENVTQRSTAELEFDRDSLSSPSRPYSPEPEILPLTRDAEVDDASHQSPQPVAGLDSGRATPSAQIDNPFASQTLRYLADSTGRPWFLGTSSNWAFTQRVLNLAHERLTGQLVQLRGPVFEADKYDIGWNGQRDSLEHRAVSLPSSDYAMYLINAVKFHCGQIFHLFDESSFMHHFYEFHDSSGTSSHKNSLWYVHYLLVLAFGKIFVARGHKGRRPPGVDLFVQAIQLLPDMTYLYTQPVESIEILCCQALYLQCLDYRGPAHNVIQIGQALRIALDQGMHTNMQGHGLDETFVQRCRNAWWTIYILDRQMSSVHGVPLAIRDEDITAELPTSWGSAKRTQALELNVKLSRIIAQILTTVYGTEGRLSRKFIPSTKSALKGVAALNETLKQSFDLPVGSSKVGVSRLSAHLHLLYHQCIVLATRPLLFTFIKSRLDSPDRIPGMVARAGSARTLLQMCIDSSRHILLILEKLQKHDLLETFLTWDLEAAFAASLVLLLTPTVDPSLLEGDSAWINMAHTILDGMVSQGNLQAAARKLELDQLQQLFTRSKLGIRGIGQPEQVNSAPATVARNDTPNVGGQGDQLNIRETQDDYSYLDDTIWQDGFSADQLMNIADSLDLDGLDWMTTGSYPD